MAVSSLQELAAMHNLTQPVMAASSLQELAAMRNLTTCELDKRRRLVTDVRTSKRRLD